MDGHDAMDVYATELHSHHSIAWMKDVRMREQKGKLRDALSKQSMVERISVFATSSPDSVPTFQIADQTSDEFAQHGRSLRTFQTCAAAFEKYVLSKPSRWRRGPRFSCFVPSFAMCLPSRSIDVCLDEAGSNSTSSLTWQLPSVPFCIAAKTQTSIAATTVSSRASILRRMGEHCVVLRLLLSGNRCQPPSLEMPA